MQAMVNIIIGLILIFGTLFVEFIKLIQGLSKLGKKVIEKKNELLVPAIRRFWPRWLTPNRLTSVRIALAPIIFAMFFDYSTWRAWILVFFSIGMVTDFFDGLVAKALDMQSRLGIILDPIADKILVVPIFFFILRENTFLLFSLVGAECILIMTALLVIFLGKDSSSNHFGKWKFTFQVVAIFLFLIFGNSAWITSMLWISVGLAVFSIIGHLKVLKR